MIKRNSFLLLSIMLLNMLIPNSVVAAVSRHASSVIVYNIDAEADGKEKVLINIYLRDGMNDSDKDTVFISTDRGSIDKFWVKKDKTWVSVAPLSKDIDDNIYYISNNIIKAEINGSLELGLTSTVMGDAKIGVSLKGERELSQYLSGHITEAQAEIIPVKYSSTPKTVTDTKYYKIAVQNETENEYRTYTENKIYINLLNKLNDLVAVDEDIKSVALNVKILNKPDNAKVTLRKSPDWETELKETGSTYLLTSSDKPGQIELDINLTLKYSNSFSPDATLNTNVTLDVKPKKFGAGEITLYLNQDTAVVDNKAYKLTSIPFIQDGRTFVPVRFLAEALGAEVKWNSDTQTVILTRPDKMITMTIGNSALLLNNGQVVLSDVAPFIKNGSTVLPFRKIAEVFGAQVSVGYSNTGEMDKVYFHNK